MRTKTPTLTTARIEHRPERIHHILLFLSLARKNLHEVLMEMDALTLTAITVSLDTLLATVDQRDEAKTALVLDALSFTL